MTSPAIVQSVEGVGNGTDTISLAVSATAAGNAIVVGAAANSGATTIAGVTDDQGNSYSRRVEEHTNRTVEWWSAENATGGVTQVDVQFSANIAATVGDAVVLELSGVPTSSTTAGTSSGSGSDADTVVNISVTGFTPSENDTLVLGYGRVGANASSWAAGADYTLDENGPRYAVVFRALGTAASQTTPMDATFGTSATRTWAAAAIAIKGDGGGGGGVVNPIFATDGIHSTVFGGQVVH